MLTLAPAAAVLLLAASPVKVQLDRDTVVDGVPCARGTAWTESGKLDQCRLATAATVGGAALPAGTVVNVTPEGALEFAFLPGDTEVDGHLCRGSGHDWMTTFHADGKVKLCWLARDETVDGVPCARATFWADVFGGGAGTTFRPDGTLESCRLSQDAVVAGRARRGGERVDRAP